MPVMINVIATVKTTILSVVIAFLFNCVGLTITGRLLFCDNESLFCYKIDLFSDDKSFVLEIIFFLPYTFCNFVIKLHKTKQQKYRFVG